MDFFNIAEEIIDEVKQRAKQKAKQNDENDENDEYLYFQAYMITAVSKLLDKQAYKLAKNKTIQNLEEEIRILKLGNNTTNEHNERGAGRKAISKEIITLVKKLKKLHPDYSTRKIAEILKIENNIKLSHTKIAEILKS